MIEVRELEIKGLYDDIDGQPQWATTESEVQYYGLYWRYTKTGLVEHLMDLDINMMPLYKSVAVIE